MDSRSVSKIIGRMLGDTPKFFREHWHKKPLYSPGADPAGLVQYSIDQFLKDMVKTQPPPYVAVRAKGGQRVFNSHSTTDDLLADVRDGGVCSMKTSRSWHHNSPESWRDLQELFGGLCRAVAMIYMNPARSEDVDVFLAGPNSCLGTHFDTTDVFTLQISGERKWVVEEDFSLDAVLELGRDPNWNPAKEIDFLRATREVTLHPGDALYVPAYSMHRVTGVSWSVSLSLGLRAYNEIDVVEHLLENLRLTRYLSYPPFPGIPESMESAHSDAKLELMRRVRALSNQIEGLAMAYFLSPMRLPPRLEGENSSVEGANVLGMFRSGFATKEVANS